MGKLAQLFLLVVFCSAPVCAQEEFKYEKKIDQLVAPYLKHNKVNAISVGLISNGEIWKKHFGRLDGPGSDPPDDRTLYEIGSISKVFTSLLLADAVVSGRVKLNDPISSIMKELSGKNRKSVGQITFLQLSHHTSGLPVMPANLKPADPTNPFAGYDRKMLTDYLLHLKLERKPGEQYEYSNLGVGLLGDLLSRQAGLSYETLLKRKLTRPLKMFETTLTLTPQQRARFAPAHNAALLAEKAWEFDALAGCGAIRSNLDEMLLFARASLNPPEGKLGQAIDLAWKQHKPARGKNRAMGLGWMIAGDRSTRWHNGQTGGYQSMILVSRRLNSATVLLCNTAGSNADALAEQIFQTIAGMDVRPKSFEKEFQIDPALARRLEGKYQLTPAVIMTIKVKNGRMMAQLTGQQFLVLLPQSETEWKYQAVEATLKFELPESGNSPKVMLYQSGRVIPFTRTEK